MDTRSTLALSETEIRNELEDWADAVRAKDVDRIFAHYAPEIVAFDAIAQLQFKGNDAYRKHWESCLTMCTGAMIFEVHELEITTGAELAFAHALNRCGGTGPDGKEMSGWMRMTSCLLKQHGKWRIVHEHFSAPFDPQSNTALWLTP
ncbi:nuclear transport factor 2 family protein [Aromatoleum evansii]|uniref:Nuclear transport factor 2 family protein n=1 Tax=Aromatoleum evansii TaxID=59406 RepID=A0ABZ1AMV6_AROEV|nr:nuclear transport factor 2 family protein [Aromatoleum evansii]